MGFCLKGKNLSDISISRRAINIKSQNSEFHNRNVVVKGIKFETLIPIPVVALPNHGEETPIQVGVRITNHTSKPYRFHLQYFLPEVLNPSRKPLEIDFGRNVTSEAQDSDIPLIFPGKSVSYLINARLGRNSEKCTALSGNAIYGGVWTFQCLIPGNYEVRFGYKSQSQKQEVRHVRGKIEIDNIWVGEVKTPFSNLIDIFNLLWTIVHTIRRFY